MYELSKSGRWLGGRIPYGFKSSILTYFDENITQRKMYQLEISIESMDIIGTPDNKQELLVKKVVIKWIF